MAPAGPAPTIQQEVVSTAVCLFVESILHLTFRPQRQRPGRQLASLLISLRAVREGKHAGMPKRMYGTAVTVPGARRPAYAGSTMW